MATTFGQAVVPQRSIRGTIPGAAIAALVVASAVTVAIAASSMPATETARQATANVNHAAGRGLVAGTDSYVDSAFAATLKPINDYYFRHQASTMALGPLDDFGLRHRQASPALVTLRGGWMEFAGAERTAQAQSPETSSARGGLPKSLEVR